MVVSWTLFRAASQESGFSGLEMGARPDEAVARFETGSTIGSPRRSAPSLGKKNQTMVCSWRYRAKNGDRAPL